MGSRQKASIPDRLATYAVVVGVMLCLAHLAGALVADEPLGRAVLSRLGVALAFLAGGCAAGWIGSRAGAVMSRVNDLSRHQSATAADQAVATREILDRLGGVELALKSANTGGANTAGAEVDPDFSTFMGEGFLQATPDSATPGSLADPAMGERIVALLEEIREVSLMNDAQRQTRLHQHLEARRRATLDQVYHCFRTGHWSTADQLLTALEAEFATDAPTKQARGEFHRQRTAAESQTFTQAEQRVRDLAHVNSWDRAIGSAQEFVNNFPANVDGRHLLTQVCRDYDAFRDSAFQRRYEQVQANVDRRLWRAALVDAQSLLEEFPAHTRANRIRQQLQTIRENAQIEERQEHEVRIQLLVTHRRFAEAVELAEEVVRRFPDSPQAEALEERIPQLRELAEHGDGNGG